MSRRRGGAKAQALATAEAAAVQYGPPMPEPWGVWCVKQGRTSSEFRAGWLEGPTRFPLVWWETEAAYAAARHRLAIGSGQIKYQAKVLPSGLAGNAEWAVGDAGGAFVPWTPRGEPVTAPVTEPVTAPVTPDPLAAEKAALAAKLQRAWDEGEAAQAAKPPALDSREDAFHRETGQRAAHDTGDEPADDPEAGEWGLWCSLSGPAKKWPKGYAPGWLEGDAGVPLVWRKRYEVENVAAVVAFRFGRTLKCRIAAVPEDADGQEARPWFTDEEPEAGCFPWEDEGFDLPTAEDTYGATVPHLADPVAEDPGPAPAGGALVVVETPAQVLPKLEDLVLWDAAAVEAAGMLEAASERASGNARAAAGNRKLLAAQLEFQSRARRFDAVAAALRHMVAGGTVIIRRVAGE